MTYEELTIILTQKPGDVVKALQVSSYSTPKWSDLEEQYNPMKHSIFDETKYPPKLDENGNDDFKRTALGLQKLAVRRMAQALFSTPVLRRHGEDKTNEQQGKAVNLLEEVYRVENSIDGSNLERAKKLLSTCQVATVWSVYERETRVGDQVSKLSLKHDIYSEKDGYSLYPINDQNGDLLVISIAYTDAAGVKYMDIYVNGSTDNQSEFIRYTNTADWALDTEASTDLDIFPVLYIHAEEPIWGGDEGTNLVEQMEEMLSYQGLYIKRNAVPTFTLDYGDIPEGSNLINTETKSDDSRRVIVVGKDGKMEAVVWQGGIETIKFRYDTLRQAVFEQMQTPDTSFANLMNSKTSADNKELVFSDARAKAKDLGGEWERLFYAEIGIVTEFLKVMFPSFAEALDQLTVKSTIRPYNVRSKKETADYIATAGDSMSLSTRVALLEEVDDPEAEVKRIEDERGANNNLLD